LADDSVVAMTSPSTAGDSAPRAAAASHQQRNKQSSGQTGMRRIRADDATVVTACSKGSSWTRASSNWRTALSLVSTSTGSQPRPRRLNLHGPWAGDHIVLHRGYQVFDRAGCAPSQRLTPGRAGTDALARADGCERPGSSTRADARPAARRRAPRPPCTHARCASTASAHRRRRRRCRGRQR